MKSDLDTKYFKQKLETELALVVKGLEDVGYRNPDNKEDWQARTSDFADSADTNETADKIEEFESHAALVNDLESRYNEIKNALARIEKGTYGLCEVSGEPIELDRLEANPSARTCKKHMEN